MPMLIGNKKSQKNNQNWCIILNPIKNELDKKKIAQKISEVFLLSAEEAADLVTNTPIILLDNLTQPIASQIKDYFRSTGAEMILTSDVFLKRKCYRTVWPNEPNLSFLKGETPAVSRKSEPSEQEEVLAAEDALDEIRSLSDESFQDGPRSVREVGFEDRGGGSFSGAEREQMSDEIRKLKEECFDLREQRNQLRLQLEQLRAHELADSSEVDAHMKHLAEDREREVKEMRALLSNAEEKYDVLKNEYREARLVYEEKMAQLEERNQEDEKIIRGFREKSSSLDQEKKNLLDLLGRKEEALRKIQEDYDSVRAAVEKQAITGKAESEKENLRTDLLSRDLQSALSEKEELRRALDERVAKFAALQDKHDEVQRLLELHIDQGLQAKRLAENYEREIREARKQLSDSQEKLSCQSDLSAREKKALEEKITELEDKLNVSGKEDQEIKTKCAMLEDDKKVLNDLLAEKDAQFKELEQDYRTWRMRAEGLTASQDAHSREAQVLKETLASRESALAELQAEYEKTRKLLQGRIDQDTRLIDELKSKFDEATRELLDAQHVKAAIENQMKAQTSDMAAWRNQADVASNELRVLKKLLADERSAREQAEGRQRDLEKSQIRILQDLEAKSQEAQDWLTKYSESEKVLADLRQTCEDQQQVLEKNAKELDARQRELDVVRRQLRDMNLQIEQREAAQRRTQLANQLMEKEEVLKNLVGQQSKIESEIREREESIRSILSQQEKVEKEIIECKQARRHLMEQTKKDRNGKTRINRPIGPNGQETEDEENFPLPSDTDAHDRTTTE